MARSIFVQEASSLKPLRSRSLFVEASSFKKPLRLDDDVTFGSDIFLTQSRTTVNNIIAEAIARSLQATDDSPTYNEIVYWMSLRVGTLTDTATRQRFNDVLIHHGFEP